MGDGSASAGELLRLYQQSASLAHFGAWECRLPENRLSWTEGVYDLFGIKRGAALHRPYTVDLYEARSRAIMERARAVCISGGTGFQLDCGIRTAGGAPRWMRLIGRIAFEHGRPARLYGTKQDVTHEKALWFDLQRQLEVDPLTGLGNRRALHRSLDEAGRLCADGAHVGLALLDLDGLSTIATRYGRLAAENALKEIAERLERTLAGATLIARIGDNEFAILLASRLGRRAVLRALTVAHKVAGAASPQQATLIAPVKAAMGVAVIAPDNPTDPADLFAQADAALSIAKSQVGGALQVFGGALDMSAALASAGPLHATD